MQIEFSDARGMSHLRRPGKLMTQNDTLWDLQKPGLARCGKTRKSSGHLQPWPPVELVKKVWRGVHSNPSSLHQQCIHLHHNPQPQVSLGWTFASCVKNSFFGKSIAQTLLKISSTLFNYFPLVVLSSPLPTWVPRRCQQRSKAWWTLHAELENAVLHEWQKIGKSWSFSYGLLV